MHNLVDEGLICEVLLVPDSLLAHTHSVQVRENNRPRNTLLPVQHQKKMSRLTDVRWASILIGILLLAISILAFTKLVQSIDTIQAAQCGNSAAQQDVLSKLKFTRNVAFVQWFLPIILILIAMWGGKSLQRPAQGVNQFLASGRRRAYSILGQ